MNDPSEERTKDCFLCDWITIFGSTFKNSFVLVVEYDYLVLHVLLVLYTWGDILSRRRSYWHG